MLVPKRVKHRKVQRGSMKGNAKVAQAQLWIAGHSGTRCVIGSPNRQIEAARIAMTRRMNRTGNVWMRVFPRQAHHQAC